VAQEFCRLDDRSSSKSFKGNKVTTVSTDKIVGPGSNGTFQDSVVFFMPFDDGYSFRRMNEFGSLKNPIFKEVDLFFMEAELRLNDSSELFQNGGAHEQVYRTDDPQIQEGT